MTLKTRTKAPAKTDKNYIRWDKGGYNYCMEMSGGSVLPNCTGYAWGRWREILGKFHELSRGNAEVWWGKQDGYERGQTPRIGAAIVWRQGVAGNAADGMGHVAIVEDILPNGDIVTSNSQYYGETFYLKTLKKPYIYKPGFILQGFIYLPIVLDKPKPNVPITPPSRPVDTAMVKQDGFFKTDRVVNIRESASTKATIVGKLAKDEEVRYDSYIKTDGHVWVSFMRVGVRVFSAWREINGETFGGCRFATAPAKPTPPAPKPVAPKLSNDAVAALVIQGRYGNGQARRDKLSSEGYNPDVIQSIVDSKMNKKPQAPAKKSNQQIAGEVKLGVWGNGADRKNKLTAAGYNYDEIQSLVNSQNGSVKPKLTNEQAADKVIRGEYGNGKVRKDKLKADGFDPDVIQSIVNRKLG